MASATHEDLDTEIELISSSLLPAETLESDSNDQTQWPRTIHVSSTDSTLSVHVTVKEGYRKKDAVTIDVKSRAMGRDEATGWQRWTEEKMAEYDESDDYPLYQILTTHFLPLLAPSLSASGDQIENPTVTSSKGEGEYPISSNISKPHHALLISHHLLSSTKRKDLLSLSSSLSLTGFSKTGHPGIMYAIGELADLEEWIREVKSWNWLALRVRITPEVIPDEVGREGDLHSGSKGKENGARGGKGRGEWTELEKINEALDWLRNRGAGREKLLMDFGVGGGAR
ncbi:hypothetical protein IAT40_003919 [Kwoniella sp. CBS 6097]